jgi:hypothetical protein
MLGECADEFYKNGISLRKQAEADAIFQRLRSAVL